MKLHILEVTSNNLYCLQLLVAKAILEHHPAQVRVDGYKTLLKRIREAIKLAQKGEPHE